MLNTFPDILLKSICLKILILYDVTPLSVINANTQKQLIFHLFKKYICFVPSTMKFLTMFFYLYVIASYHSHKKICYIL